MIWFHNIPGGYCFDSQFRDQKLPNSKTAMKLLMSTNKFAVSQGSVLAQDTTFPAGDTMLVYTNIHTS